MLSLTRKADYAIVALVHMAHRGSERSSAREVAESTQVPLPMLTNILHQLLHHGLITSAMGSKGGYLLAKPAERISLVQIIDAIEGPFKLTVCCESEPNGMDDHLCDLEDGCQVKEPLRRVHRSLRRFLNQITLAHLAYGNVPVDATLSMDEVSRSENQPAGALE